MAARVNTRFIVILASVLALLVVAVGGMWYIQRRADTQRHIVAGDELMAAGAYRDAADRYGRAVSKQPGNVHYLEKMKSAVEQIVPQTPQDALTQYDRLLQLLERLATFRPEDAQAHLLYLDELYAAARIIQLDFQWRKLIEPATTMLERVAPGDEHYHQGQLYRAMARMRTVKNLTDEEFRLADEDFVAYLEHDPASEIAWGERLRGHAIRAGRPAASGQLRAAEQRLAATERLLDEAIAAAGSAGVHMRRAIVEWNIVQLMRKNPDMPIATVLESIRDLVDAAVSSGDPLDLIDVIDRAFLDIQATRTLADAMGAHVETQPDAIVHRYYRALLLQRSGDGEQAAVVARSVIDAPIIRVSIIGREQQSLQKRAASIIVDGRYQQFFATEDPVVRAEVAKALDDARAELLTFCPNPDADLALANADGKIAMTRLEYEKAVDRFEFVIRSQPGVDADTYALSALALEKIGEAGLAFERVRDALGVRVGDPRLLEIRMRLEFAMGRMQDCAATLELLAEARPDHPSLAEWRSTLQTRLAGTAGGTDPVADLLRSASGHREAGRLADARAALLEAHRLQPENVAVLRQIVQLEFEANDFDAARHYLGLALAKAPEDPGFLSLQAALDGDNIVDAYERLGEIVFTDPILRSIAIGTDLSRLDAQLRAEAATLDDTGDSAGAAEQRRLAGIARTKADAYLAQARAAAPDHPRLVDFEFSEALRAGDYETATAIATRVGRSTADPATAAMFRARMAVTRGAFADAVRELDDVIVTKPYESVAWRLRAFARTQLGRLGEAEEDYAQALRRNPNDATTVTEYERLLRRTGQDAKALNVLRQAVEAMPANAEIRERYLLAEEAVGDLGTVLARRRDLDVRRSGTGAADEALRINAIRLAQTLGSAQPQWQLITDERDRPKYDRDSWTKLPEDQKRVQLNRLRETWASESEAILDSLDASLTGIPRLQVAQLRAKLRRDRGNFDGGRRELQRLVDLQKTPAERAIAMTALGDYLARSGRTEEAITTFKAAAAIQDDDNRVADRALAGLYAQAERFDLAAPLYERFTQTNSNPDVEAQLIECLAKLQRFDEADRRLKALVARVDETMVMSLLRSVIAYGRADAAHAAGRLPEGERGLGDAIDLVEATIAKYPTLTRPYIQLAIYRMAEAEWTGRDAALDEALNALATAGRLDATDSGVRLVRRQVMLRRGDITGAINELRAVVKAAPLEQKHRRDLIAMLINSTPPNLGAAIELASEATRLFPESAEWREGLGELYYRRRDLKQAADQFEQSLAIAPNDATLIKLASLRLEQEPSDPREALRLFDTRPGVLEDPLVLAIRALAFQKSDRRGDAIVDMERSYEGLRRRIREGRESGERLTEWLPMLGRLFDRRPPSEVEAFLMKVSKGTLDYRELRWLAAVWAGSGPDGISRGTELLRQALTAAPANLPDTERAAGYRALGTYLLLAGDFAGAAAALSEVLKYVPDHVETLNDYAFILGDRLGRVDEAIPYATRAMALRADDPNITDTLGTLKYHAGDYAEARRLLERAVALRPNASSYITLAKATIALKDYDAARTYLREAEKMRPTPQAQEEIQRLEADIRQK
ncbi:MAG: tetratricopeptide repeat protein [Phycisphaerales bacterium]|nr:tetratricopeptide repeat protein [Phycisphaerales bacterium]